MRELLQFIARNHPARSAVHVLTMTLIVALFQMPGEYVLTTALVGAGVMLAGGRSVSRLGFREPDHE